jgi:hypothetical protein
VYSAAKEGKARVTARTNAVEALATAFMGFSFFS